MHAIVKEPVYRYFLKGLWAFPLWIFSQNSFSLPVGAEFVEGVITGSTVPGDLNHQVIIQESPKAIINWEKFNIGIGETTEFRQPSNRAIVLNRVTGQNASLIQGALKANGQVWLINPSGILFGPSAKVDVAGLLATTST